MSQGSGGRGNDKDGVLGCPHSRLPPALKVTGVGLSVILYDVWCMSAQQQQQLYFLDCSEVRRIGPDTPSQVIYPPLSHLYGSPRLLDLL